MVSVFIGSIVKWDRVSGFILGELGRWEIHEDGISYHSNAEGNLQDEILTPVDDFFIAGPDFFIIRVVVHIGCLFILDLEMFGWLLCCPATQTSPG